VAVFLSEYEGFGLPAMESMARGIPVVASRRPSLSEVCAEAALLVEPDDPVGVAAAIDRVLRDEPLCAQLSASGRRRAAGYRWEETARLTWDVVREVAR
jgi:glycosyltransferase involved in cell wall biosynthesis